MYLFAQIRPDELAVRSSVESLGRIFLVVLALAIGEAFKQFVADKAEKPEARHIHWDRVLALIAFVVLVVPFSHGMARYFFETYQERRPTPYAAYLFLDSIVFTAESVLFFVLSRSLPRVQWRRFYWTVLILLVVDIAWGSFAAFQHSPLMWNWVRVNLVTAPFLLAILLAWRGRDSATGLVLSTALIFARTVADYALNFSFYFPPQP